MPEARLARTRASLPAGYQHPTPQRVRVTPQMVADAFTQQYANYQGFRVPDDWNEPWRAPHLNAAAQLHRKAGDEHGT